jgi:hypothetical protein
VLFDGFYDQAGQPPVIPGSAIAVPAELTAAFATEYRAFTVSGGAVVGPLIGGILAALAADPTRTAGFLTAAGLGYLVQYFRSLGTRPHRAAPFPGKVPLASPSLRPAV